MGTNSMSISSNAMKKWDDIKRYHQVRGRSFSEFEMEKFRIRGIYNLSGVVDRMGEDYIREYSMSLIRPGSMEISIATRAIDTTNPSNPIIICSIMIFQDRFAFGHFALTDGLRERYWSDGEFDESVLCLLN